MNTPPTIIAIDGPSASGKGTVAKKLAAHFDFALLDTGLLYRAVALLMKRKDDDFNDAEKAAETARNLKTLYTVLFEEAKLREDAVSKAASIVAAYPGVRTALLNFQQDFCKTPPDGKPGAVLDGRDIGTVIAPQAPVKIYVTASTEVRAQRRFKELQGRGENTSYEAVLKDIQERDIRDASRATAPAKPAADAVILDTTHLDAEQAFAEALKIAEGKLK